MSLIKSRTNCYVGLYMVMSLVGRAEAKESIEGMLQVIHLLDGLPQVIKPYIFRTSGGCCRHTELSQL